MQSNREIRILNGFLDPLSLPALWPHNVPLLLIGGTGRFAVVPTEFEAVEFGEWLDRPLAGEEITPEIVAGACVGFPFLSGHIAILAYDDLRELATRGSVKMPISKIYRIYRALVFDCVDRRVWATCEDRVEACPEKERDRTVYAVPESLWAFWLERGVLQSSPAPDAAIFQLAEASGQTPESSDAAYLRVAEQVLADIRNGRFYQANILRYFRANGTPLAKVAARIRRCGGPWSALVAAGDLVVASFSPERFVLIEPDVSGENRGLRATTEPIKGTAARSSDPVRDVAAAKSLATSEKDLAELHMIVDLLRNDLNRISESGSVTVECAGEVHSFAHVHHLVAKVTSRLRKGLKMREVLEALCPGGSITGAPKREVMRAIRDYEGRDRGFFMGNVILHDLSGRLDSSILIRTLVSNDGGNTFGFAAGSGIVVDSSPELELAEITAKCRVVAGPD